MTTPATTTDCLICEAPGASFGLVRAGGVLVDCKNCGRHELAGLAQARVMNGGLSPTQRAQLGYAVVRLAAGSPITSEHMQALLDRLPPLPEPSERLDLLIRLMADAGEPGTVVDLNPKYLRARLGCMRPEAAQWVIDQAEAEKLISRASPGAPVLTSAGWHRHFELLRSGASSKHAFMAMDFNFPEQTAFLVEHLQPAVAQTGFELRTTNHSQKTAGLIDNRMRVEIRTSRFLVCDLTHSNRGAYWEAGFAEGLGRPVFYICSEDVLKSPDKATQPHFDTNHQQIVTWNPTDPTRGVNELKDLIRATLPAEARMQD